MAHFAKIDDNNIVLRVDPLADSIATDEAAGQAHQETHTGWPAAKWIQTDNKTKRNAHLDGGTPFRGNFAAVGYEWDAANDVFWPPKGNHPDSWVKNNSTADWESPAGLIPALDDAKKLTHFWKWDEDNTQWVDTEYPTPIPQADYDGAEDKEEILGRKR